MYGLKLQDKGDKLKAAQQASRLALTDAQSSPLAAKKGPALLGQRPPPVLQSKAAGGGKQNMSAFASAGGGPVAGGAYNPVGTGYGRGDISRGGGGGLEEGKYKNPNDAIRGVGAGPADPTLPQNKAAWLDRMFAGPVDTTEDEALVRELMAAQAGQGVADARARMGVLGFTGGALGALEGDVRGAAAQDAAAQILALRRGAREEDLARGMAGAGVLAADDQLALEQLLGTGRLDLDEALGTRGLDIREDELAIKQQAADLAEDMLRAELEGANATGGGGGGPVDFVGAVLEDPLGSLGAAGGYMAEKLGIVSNTTPIAEDDNTPPGQTAGTMDSTSASAAGYSPTGREQGGMQVWANSNGDEVLVPYTVG